MNKHVLNMNSTEIRRATNNDYEDLCLLFSELDAFHVAILPESFRPFEGPARPVELVNEMLTSENRMIFLAVRNKEVAGFVDVKKSSNPPYPMFIPKDFALIENLYVRSEFRGTGLAHNLFEKAKEWAKSQGFSNLQLKVYNKNESAIKFYLKEGLLPLNTTFEIDLR
jgi:GNAT superfamily N-acetyltransferase